VIASQRLALGTCALGRAIDAHGLPLDRGPMLRGRSVRLELRSPRPNERAPISTPLWTGVRVLDGLLTIGRGARVGIFGAPGAGKTTLIESIVESCAADAVVVALVGERGREAQRWIERRDGRVTVVCATSDCPAQERVSAAHVAVTHAGALRERGLHVLLVLDSLARFAAALREIAAAAGESAGRGGYPPSVFAGMARLVEVAGALERGSITLVATVIHDGDQRDPVSEAARSVLDGHVALCSRLAEAGRFPAVDVPASASRTMEAAVDELHLRAASKVRRALALLDRIDDARALGIEPGGSAARAAIAAESGLEAFLRQGRRASECGATLSQLLQLAAHLEDDRGDP
jgi:ATP synthase in type III secretion protein N